MLSSGLGGVAPSRPPRLEMIGQNSIAQNQSAAIGRIGAGSSPGPGFAIVWFVASPSRPMPSPSVRAARDPERIHAVLQQFRVLLRSIKRHYQSVEQRSRLGGSQVWALAEIAANPDIRVGDLARRLAIHLSTASNLVGRMVEMGVVTRERIASDQRVVRLRITESGRAALRRAPGPPVGLLQQALLDLPPAARPHEAPRRTGARGAARGPVEARGRGPRAPGPRGEAQGREALSGRRLRRSGLPARAGAPAPCGSGSARRGRPARRWRTAARSAPRTTCRPRRPRSARRSASP